MAITEKCLQLLALTVTSAAVATGDQVPYMRDSGRIAAAIELITECEQSWQKPRGLPADIIINRYFKARRFIGSKDRGAIAELVYFIIRNRSILGWWAQQHGLSSVRAMVIAAEILQFKNSAGNLQKLFDGEPFSPAPMDVDEQRFAKLLSGKTLLHEDMPDYVRYNYAQWLEKDLKLSLGDNWKQEMEALNTEASVDLRANTLLTTRDNLLNALTKEGYSVTPAPLSPIGIRMEKRAPIFTSEYFKQGWFEMQDEGSQLVSLMLGAKPSDKVIDFCAGAGGKTLALAAQMKNKGRILAWDTSKKRLDQMPDRLKRAKVDNVQRHVIESENDGFIKRHKNSADAVLVDAPCSGSGTWRRNPDLKWRFSATDLAEILDLQGRILESASRLVKINGHLLYVTCSLLKSENEMQIETFLQRHKNFIVVSQEKIWNNLPQETMRQGDKLRLTPHKDGTDGFFAYLMQRCE